MAQGKGGKGARIVISLEQEGSGEGEGEGIEEDASTLREKIIKDPLLNEHLRESLLRKIDHGGSLDEVKMTYGESQKLANPETHSMMKQRPVGFMEG